MAAEAELAGPVPPMRVSSYDRDAPVPAVGSRWIWERGNPRAQVTIKVTGLNWNGEEWWVEASVVHPPLPGGPYWNDLDRFWEAVSPVPDKRMGT